MSAAITTAAAPASLEQLKELALPAPAVSYFPQTWGWLALLLILLLGLGFWASLRWWHWQRNRYRREALARLDELEQTLGDEERLIPALRELPELLKRVALSMPERPDVAALSGENWQAFLEKTSAAPLPKGFSRQLANLAYATDCQLRGLSSTEREALLALSRRWVETHHAAA
ncbi:MAG: DUF4381 domain-containing protein [Pseudomonas sp.]